MDSIEKMNAGVIILATGRGLSLNDQFVKIGEKTLLDIAVEKYKPYADTLIVVVPKSFYNEMSVRYDHVVVVEGGVTELKSIKNGFLKFSLMSELPDTVLIADAARPNTSDELIRRIMRELENNVCVIPALKAYETVIEYKKDIEYVRYLEDLDKLYFCQTPEGYTYEYLKYLITCAERYGYGNGEYGMAYYRQYCWVNYGQFDISNTKIKIVMGEKDNFRIDSEHDLKVAKLLLGEK